MSEARPTPGAGDGDGAAPPTAGKLLRAARERQGVHLAVLAASLKVAQRKLELIESDRYDELPDASFARALALSMCRALKIDAEPVLARLPLARGERLEPLTRGLNQPFREHDGHQGSSERRGGPSLPVVAAALLTVAALVVYFLPGRSWTSGEVSPAAVSDPVVAAEPPAASPAVPANPGGLVPPEPATEAPSLAASAAAPQAPASSTVIDTVFAASAPPAASAPAAAGLLTLRATGQASWVEVRDAANRLLLSRTLAAGESANVDGATPLRVTIGNAAATEVTFRGEPVNVRNTRENVARLELK